MTVKIEEFKIHSNGFSEIIDITQKINDIIKNNTSESAIILIETDCDSSSVYLLKNNIEFIKFFNEFIENCHKYKTENLNEDIKKINILKSTILGKKCLLSIINNKLNIKNNDKIILIDYNDMPTDKRIITTLMN